MSEMRKYLREIGIICLFQQIIQVYRFVAQYNRILREIFAHFARI